MKRALITCLCVVLPSVVFASTALEIGTSPIIGILREEEGRFSFGIGGDFQRASLDDFNYVLDTESGFFERVPVTRQITVFTPTILIRYHLTAGRIVQPHLAAKLSKGIPSNIEGFDSPSDDYRKTLDDYSLDLLSGLRTQLQDNLLLGGEAGLRVTWLTRAFDAKGTLLKGKFDVFLQVRL